MKRTQKNPTGFPPGFPPAHALSLFTDYLRITGVAHSGPEAQGDPRLIGKRLGLLNGSSWIALWSNFFGKMYLPGVHLVNAGNEAVQINFIESYAAGAGGLPAANKEAFKRYALDLVELAKVDAVLITCSTMNRAYSEVQSALEPYGVPVMQIDRPMMERAVHNGGRILVIATHGPTVEATRLLLQEAAEKAGRSIETASALVEEAFEFLAHGDVEKHNALLAETIRREVGHGNIGCVVLAQLSMSTLLFSYPHPLKEFGVPVFTSGQCGFEAIRDLLAGSSVTTVNS